MRGRWRRRTTICHLELVRRWRSLTGKPIQVIAIGIAGVFMLPLAAVTLLGAYAFGVGIGTGEIESAVEISRQLVVYTWLLVVGLGGYRTYLHSLRPAGIDGMLTTVSHRDLLAGLVMTELVLWAVPVLPLTALAAIVFALGVGTVIAVPMIVGTAVTILVTGLLVGTILALVVRNTGVRSRLLTRLRTVAFVGLGVGYLWLLVTQAFDTVLAPMYWLLEPTPVGWFGDAMLVGTPAEWSIGPAVGAAITSGLFLVLGGVVAARLAGALWYADGVHIDRTVESGTAGPLSGWMAGILPRPILGVVTADLKRARRAPVSLSYVLYPMLVLIGPVSVTIETGAVGSGFPLWVVLCGVWITGALFTLNVLGHEGAVLPATLLGPHPGSTLIRGHVLGSVAIGLPVTAGGAMVLGALSPRSPAMVLVLVAGAIPLTAAAAGIAAGVGAVFPRFDAVRVSRSRKAVVPSTIAFVIYSLAVGIVTLPLLGGHSALLGHAIADWVAVSRLHVAVVGIAISVIGGLTVGTLSAKYAIRTVETYHFE